MKDRTISQLAPIGASVVLLLGGSFMGGCAEMIECTGETYYVDGRCEPLLDGSPDAGRDASPSVDAQGPDAGPCSDCDGHCIDGRCVECTPETEATDCTEEGKSVCLDNTCVGCTDDADCTDPSKARCDQTTHTCVACQEDAECEAGRARRPAPVQRRHLRRVHPADGGGALRHAGMRSERLRLHRDEPRHGPDL